LLPQGLGEARAVGQIGLLLTPSEILQKRGSLSFAARIRSLRTIVIWRHIRVGHKGKDPVSMLDQTQMPRALLWMSQRHAME
jgi:hypothetical protein